MTKTQRIRKGLVANNKLAAGAVRNTATVALARKYGLSTGAAGSQDGDVRRLAVFTPGGSYFN